MAEQLVTKELKFEAAHRLGAGYPGKCRHNHGHSWIVFVTVGLRAGVQLDEYGFVKDFGDFKPIRDWCDEMFDHATIVSDVDHEFVKWLRDNDQKCFVMGGNPTSENLASLIYNQAVMMLEDERCFVHEVRIKETCTSEAIHRREA